MCLSVLIGQVQIDCFSKQFAHVSVRGMGKRTKVHVGLRGYLGPKVFELFGHLSRHLSGLLLGRIEVGINLENAAGNHLSFVGAADGDDVLPGRNGGFCDAKSFTGGLDRPEMCNNVCFEHVDKRTSC
jgi:hypothetical protein